MRQIPDEDWPKIQEAARLIRKLDEENQFSYDSLGFDSAQERANAVDIVIQRIKELLACVR